MKPAIALVPVYTAAARITPSARWRQEQDDENRWRHQETGEKPEKLTASFPFCRHRTGNTAHDHGNGDNRDPQTDALIGAIHKIFLSKAALPERRL